MLPRRDGFAVCRTIRESGCAVPILMLTARDAVEARIEGLDCGADDYLVKPFDFGELLARLRALIRRGRQPLLPERLTVGPLAIDTRSRQVRVRDADVLLTAKEYALLEYLVRRAGDVVSRADISEHVWDEHHDPLSNVVDVYVQRLRRKLDRSGTDSLIRTRRGEGYQLVVGDGRCHDDAVAARAADAVVHARAAGRAVPVRRQRPVAAAADRHPARRSRARRR